MTGINFSRNLRMYREAKGWSKAEMAKRVGVADVTLGQWESGVISPRMKKVELIAKILGIKPDDLLFGAKPVTHTTIQPIASSAQVPLYGTIAAGIPLEMIEAQEYIEIPENVFSAHPNAFLLEVKGDSMNKIVPDGVYALIEPCTELHNGDILAVNVNGYEATLKRFYRLQKSIVLEPDSYNSEHTPQMYVTEDNIKILGKLVWYMPPHNVKY